MREGDGVFLYVVVSVDRSAKYLWLWHIEKTSAVYVTLVLPLKQRMKPWTVAVSSTGRDVLETEHALMEEATGMPLYAVGSVARSES